MEAHGPSRQAAKQSVGWFRVQELHERISGCSGLHVPESLYSLCGRKAMLKKKKKKLCEKKKGACSGLYVPESVQSLWMQSNTEEEEEIV